MVNAVYILVIAAAALAAAAIIAGMVIDIITAEVRDRYLEDPERLEFEAVRARRQAKINERKLETARAELWYVYNSVKIPNSRKD